MKRVDFIMIERERERLKVLFRVREWESPIPDCSFQDVKSSALLT